MQLFYGLLTPGDPRLIGTDYDTLNYYCNNFDNFVNALVTLFELMVVNNWQVRGREGEGKKMDERRVREGLFGGNVLKMGKCVCVPV